MSLFRKSSRSPTTTQKLKKMVTAAESASASANAVVQEGGNVLKRGWARLSRRRPKEKETRIVDEVADEIKEDPVDVHLDQHQLPSSSVMVQELDKRNFVNRGMDRLRRSFRKSFHIGQKGRLTANEGGRSSPTQEPSTTTCLGAGSKPNVFQPDEASVRSGQCQFHVKSKKRAVKAILYVSGDSLRVVDQESNRGLILDQTVEKVSFCAPDRNNDKGFAYICRDGATRRWMCHGFMAGERLSHAVGCSFAICLEKKRKREAEMAVFMSAKHLAEEVNADLNGLSRQNQAYSSFRRQLSIAERRQDPQTAILAEPIPIQRSQSTSNAVDLIDTTCFERNSLFSDDPDTSKPRPTSNPSLFGRQQNSFRLGTTQQTIEPNNQFRRFNSLRTDLNGKVLNTLRSLHNEPIYEGDEDWPGAVQESSAQFENNSFNSGSCLPSSSSMNEFNLGFNDANKENGLISNGYKTDHKFNQRPNSVAPTVVSSADQWLSQILQYSGTTSNTVVSASDNQSNDLVANCVISGPPPNQPPPPLPPQTVLETPQKSLFSVPSSSIQPSDVQIKCSQLLLPPRRPSAEKRKSIEYQILEETDVPPQSPPRIVSPLTNLPKSNEIDLFGQPIFDPLSKFELPSTSKDLPQQVLMQDEVETDPFDVQWTDQVLESARSSKLTMGGNPFSQESASVNV